MTPWAFPKTNPLSVPNDGAIDLHMTSFLSNIYPEAHTITLGNLEIQPPSSTPYFKRITFFWVELSSAKRQPNRALLKFEKLWIPRSPFSFLEQTVLHFHSSFFHSLLFLIICLCCCNSTVCHNSFYIGIL